MDILPREQLEQTWRGLQALSRNVPASAIPSTMTQGFSDTALRSIIKGQVASLDGNASFAQGRSRLPDTDKVERLDADSGKKPRGMRDAARDTIKAALENTAPAGADLTSFHALLAAHTDQLGTNIPDFAFDGTITASERAAAVRIAQGLEQGQPAAEIRKSFATSASQIKTDQAQAEAQSRIAAQQQQGLDTTADSYLAAAGYIDPDRIGALSATQRGAALTQFMKDHAERLQASGTAAARIGNLAEQQEAAIDFANGYALKPDALAILRTGMEGAQLGESVKAWLESGDPNQIRMAQAVMNHPVTGTLDTDTHAAGTAYVRTAYASDLKDIPALRNTTGTDVDPSRVYAAANNGRLYMPTDAELEAAGMDPGLREAIKAAPDAGTLLPQRAALKEKDAAAFTEQDKVVWASDTRQELIAQQFMADPALYKQIVEARNARMKDAAIDAEPTSRQVEQAQNYDAIPKEVPTGVELPANTRILRGLSADKQNLLQHRGKLVEALEKGGETEHAQNIARLDGQELVDYLRNPEHDAALNRSAFTREPITRIKELHRQIDMEMRILPPDQREAIKAQGQALQPESGTEQRPGAKVVEKPETSQSAPAGGESTWDWVRSRLFGTTERPHYDPDDLFKGARTSATSPEKARGLFGDRAAGVKEQPAQVEPPPQNRPPVNEWTVAP